MRRGNEGWWTLLLGQQLEGSLDELVHAKPFQRLLGVFCHILHTHRRQHIGVGYTFISCAPASALGVG